MTGWCLFESLLNKSLRHGTLMRVEVVDEGGLRDLAGEEPVLLAANHQSHIDTSIIFHAVPAPRRSKLRIVASDTRFNHAPAKAPWRERLERWFLHGLAAHAYRAIFVGGDIDPHRSVDVITDAIKTGASVVLFPEGTRTRDGALGKLRPGVALTAIATRCRVIPVRIDGTREALPRSRRMLSLRSRVTVRFRSSIVAQQHEASDAFLEKLAARLAPVASHSTTGVT
ncbi:MAG: 1-acyl-sn-glycerol-3-phosphate acyltransferase [Planctomycetes bacterium]|nr:1-acyl-sn-glycerol-3-phosphate acyltransferase [Planctomycetota bacterium]